MWMYIHVCVASGVWCACDEVNSLGALNLQSLSLAWKSWVEYADWPASPTDLPVAASLILGFKSVYHCVWLFHAGPGPRAQVLKLFWQAFCCLGCLLSLCPLTNIPTRIEEGLGMLLTDSWWLPGEGESVSPGAVAHGRLPMPQGVELHLWV